MTSVGAGRQWATVVSVGGVLALVGCSDGGAVEPTATVSPSPTATEPGGLAPPERPAAMANGDEAGAQAAAEYFAEVFGYSVESQDVTDLGALCDSSSNFCRAVLDEIASDVEAGNSTIGGAALFRVARLDPATSEQPFHVAWGTLERTPFVTVDAAGLEIYSAPGSAGDFMVIVEFTQHGWVVRGAEAGVAPST